MVFPAFPQPNENGRVNVYATRIDNGKTFDGEVSFLVRNNSWKNWFSEAPEEVIGTQLIDDGVYRQGFVFEEKGDYIIQAKFVSDGQDYAIDFPLQIGDTSALGPIGITITLLMILLIGVNIIKRKTFQRANAQKERSEKPSNNEPS